MSTPFSSASIEQAARLLKQGGLVAFPTETYYGLGVDPFNHLALQRLFTIKQRAHDKAVLVLVQGRQQLTPLVQSIPKSFVPLMNHFWPGPLTLIFPARPHLPKLLTGGTGTIGIRHSPNPIALSLIKAMNNPVSATSANRASGIPATTAEEVDTIFGNDIDLILDGGKTPGGRGSTLVGFEQKLVCLRQGVLKFSTIQKVVK